MLRKDKYNSTGFVQREEITRELDNSVRYRRYDGTLTLVEDRIATEQEEAALEAKETEERETTIRTQIEAALETLSTQYNQAQTIINQTATTIAEVNTALDVMANHIQTLQRMVAKLIRLEQRKLDATE